MEPSPLAVRMNLLVVFGGEPGKEQCKGWRGRMQGLTLGGLRDVLKEFHDNIGNEGGEDEAQRARNRVMKMLSALGYKDDEAQENGTLGGEELDLPIDAPEVKAEGGPRRTMGCDDV